MNEPDTPLEVINRARAILESALIQYVESTLEPKLGRNWPNTLDRSHRSRRNVDFSTALSGLQQYFTSHFKFDDMDKDRVSSLIYKVRDTRNKCSHNEAFDRDEAFADLVYMEKFSSALGLHEVAARLANLRTEWLVVTPPVKGRAGLETESQTIQAEPKPNLSGSPARDSVKKPATVPKVLPPPVRDPPRSRAQSTQPKTSPSSKPSAGDLLIMIGATFCVVLLAIVLIAYREHPRVPRPKGANLPVAGKPDIHLSESSPATRLFEIRAYPGVTTDRPDLLRRALLKGGFTIPAGTNVRILFDDRSKLGHNLELRLLTGRSDSIKISVNRNIYRWNSDVADTILCRGLRLALEAQSLPPAYQFDGWTHSDEVLVWPSRGPVSVTVSSEVYRGPHEAPFNIFSVNVNNLFKVY